MSLAQQLIDLGFTPSFPGGNGDFVLQDDGDGDGDGDGRGAYIREWRSNQPCPFPELVREP